MERYHWSPALAALGLCVVTMHVALLHAAPDQSAFEVASIKPSGPKSVRGSEGGPGSSDPGRYRYGRADLQILIMIAYNVDSFQVSGKIPLDKDEFDIDAKVPLGSDKEQFRAMLQNLLAERFHLRLHVVSKEFPAYALTVSRTGHKLTQPAAPAPARQPDDGFPDLPPGRPGLIAANSMTSDGLRVVRMKGQQQTLPSLARMLRTTVDKPVVDETGLTGKYDFKLEYTVGTSRTGPDGQPELAPASDVSVAILQQLGLQLVEKRVPFEVLIVDSVDRMPVEN